MSRWRVQPSPVEWLCLAGGLSLTLYYAWLLDDAYVYFRYVDNLVFLGHGLVYNRGEYVEGFSSPLWTLLLSLLRLSGLNYWILVRAVALLSFTAFWWGLVLVRHRLSPPGVEPVNFPLALLSFAYGPLCYFTSGLESPLVQVAAPFYALFILEPRSLAFQLALALTPLLRHELAVPLVLCLGWSWWRLRVFPTRLFAIAAAVTGAWMTFRIYYYADLFPNTFYLKDLADVRQGLVYLRQTVESYWLHAWLAAHVVVLWLVRIRGRRSETGDTGAAAPPLHMLERAFMVLVAASVAVYVVRIGGDPRHYRYLAFPVALGLCALSGIIEQGVGLLSASLRPWASRALGAMVAAAAFFSLPPQLLDHPFWPGGRVRMVDNIRDAAEHRRIKLSPPPFASGAEIEQTSAYRATATDRSAQQRRATAHGGCYMLYQQWDQRAIQSMGLTDAILARTEMKPDRPAHKLGLRPLGRDLLRIHLRRGNALPDRGMYRAEVEAGLAPAWIERNLASIELIERKIYNRHDFLENLKLAFTRVPRIVPNHEVAPTAHGP